MYLTVEPFKLQQEDFAIATAAGVINLDSILMPGVAAEPRNFIICV
jgi:hypothetical protein